MLCSFQVYNSYSVTHAHTYIFILFQILELGIRGRVCPFLKRQRSLGSKGNRTQLFLLWDSISNVHVLTLTPHIDCAARGVFLCPMAIFHAAFNLDLLRTHLGLTLCCWDKSKLLTGWRRSRQLIALFLVLCVFSSLNQGVQKCLIFFQLKVV